MQPNIAHKIWRWSKLILLLLLVSFFFFEQEEEQTSVWRDSHASQTLDDTGLQLQWQTAARSWPTDLCDTDTPLACPARTMHSPVGCMVHFNWPHCYHATQMIWLNHIYIACTVGNIPTSYYQIINRISTNNNKRCAHLRDFFTRLTYTVLKYSLDYYQGCLMWAKCWFIPKGSKISFQCKQTSSSPTKTEDAVLNLEVQRLYQTSLAYLEVSAANSTP